MMVIGADSIHSYQTILQQIVYFNRKPAYYLNRAFKLSCSELNGRFSSNDYIQTLTVIHPKIEKKDISTSTAATHQVLVQPALVAKAQVHNHRVEAKESKVSSAGFLDSGLMDVGTDTVARASNTSKFLSIPILLGGLCCILLCHNPFLVLSSRLLDTIVTSLLEQKDLIHSHDSSLCLLFSTSSLFLSRNTELNQSK